MGFRIWKFISLVGVLLFLQPGCGNGEGVGSANRIPPGPVGVSGTYYDLAPTHICPSSSTYRNSISYVSGTYKHLDNCTGVETTLTVAQLEISQAYAVLGYGADIYENRATTPVAGDPAERYMQVFCVSNSGLKDVEFFVRTGPSVASPYGILALSSTGWSGIFADVSENTVGTVTTYEASGSFSLSVDSSSSINANEYNGVLTVNGEGATRPMACRLVN